MAGAMGSTATTMAAVNKELKVEDIQKTMMNFEKESTKMDMAGELSEGGVNNILVGIELKFIVYCVALFMSRFPIVILN